MRQYDPPGGLGRDVDPPTAEEETGEIRVEIEQTRTELSGTIDAIQQKLNPEVLTEQAKDIAHDVAEQAKDAAQTMLEQAIRDVKDAALEVTEHAVQEVKEAAREVTGQAKDAAWDATIGKAEHAVEATVESVEDAVSSAGQAARGVSSMVIDTIKQNPVPAALAGLMLGWLFMNRSSGQPTSSYYRGETSHRPYPPLPQYGDRPTTFARQEQGAVGKIADKVGGAASQVGDTASDVVSGAGEMVSDAASSAGRMASSAGETAMDAGSDVFDLIKRNPMPAALAGLGLTWLYTSRSSGQPAHGTVQPGRTSYRYDSGRTAYGSERGRTSYRYEAGRTPSATQEQGTVGKLADTVGGAAGQVTETASGAVSSAGQMVSGVASTAGRVVGDVASGAGQMASSVGETAVDTGSDVLELIRQNPVPAALTGLGLAWLYMNRSTARQPYQAYSGSAQWQGSYDRRGYQPQGGFTEMERRAQQSTGRSSGQTAMGSQAILGRLQGMVEDNPMMTAALATTLGAAVGLGLPPTSREDQLLGKTRDSLMGKAEQVTQDTIEKVQSVATEAQTTVEKAAKVQGLTV